MVDITFKTFTLRKAIAAATIKTSAISTVEAVKNGTVPKGNVLEFARASALLAIKKTAMLFRTAILYPWNLPQLIMK